TSFLPFLNFTPPSPHIFHSLASFLQVQPQTLFPNGHTIASVTISRATLLYHGRCDNDSVPSPEWLAFDIEMAYGIMGNMPDSRMLTYRTARNIQAIYFDGTSATARFLRWCFYTTGRTTCLNVADVDESPRLPPGRRPPGHWNPLQEEYFRARELCKWIVASGLGGKGWGYEGILQMNAGFELIWCDFESPSLDRASNLSVSVPRPQMDKATFRRHRQLSEVQAPFSGIDTSKDEGPHGPGMTDPQEPFRNTSNWFWFAAAAKRYTGDSRIMLDPSGIFSFYEPGLHNQTRARIEGDIERLGLRSDGKWEARRSDPLQSVFSTEQSERTKQLHALSTRRRYHQLTSVDKDDGVYMRNAVEERLKASISAEADSSGTDCHYIAKEIITRYTNELQTLLDYLRRVPKPYETHQTIEKWTFHVRHLTHWFLLPFFEYPPDPPYAKENLQKLFSVESPLANTTLERCVSQCAANVLPESSSTIFASAISETLHALCSTTLKIALDIEYHWFKYFDPKPPPSDIRTTDAYYYLILHTKEWEEDIQELIAWLGWAEQWSGCKEKCGVGETCYLPMWPVSRWGGRRRGEESRFLWEGVCVGMLGYPPEE
ncbi:hypothetical protein K458DRAFT_294470, partial [Lentithecium fluviatile CBS 122367]